MGDPYLQMTTIIEIMKKAIEELGGKLECRSYRIFVTNIEDFERIGEAHGVYFSDIKPASTVEVSALVDPEM